MCSIPALLLACLLAIARPVAASDDKAQHAVILQYHHFGSDTPASTSVTLPQFDRHLEYLAENGYRVWPLQQIVERLRSGKPLPDRVVAITIDDAFISVYREAYPRLLAHNWPFTVFVATRPVDSGSSALMNWEQMREMAAHGVTFGNHSLDHAHLVRRRAGEDESAWRARVRMNILQAQQRLEQELGKVPRWFAYPYGEYDTSLRGVLGELGFTGFGQQSGPAGHGVDFLALPRFAMAVPYASLDEFSTKVKTRPLPVAEAEPLDPLLPVEQSRPVLQVRLLPGDYDAAALVCYVSGQGRVAPVWLDREAMRFEVRAAAPLPVGRSRYNCTAPASQGNGYFWYSHLWIRRHPDGSWYTE
jgi:peptidoglycan/xylan/chitin deacetylase (PgdA/CDA1 family)